MDLNSKCNDDADSTTQKPNQKDESASQNNDTESTEKKPQTVLIKNHADNLEDQTAALKYQHISTLDQLTDPEEQPDISKKQITQINIHGTAINHDTSLPEEKVVLPIIHNIDEPSSSKEHTASKICFGTADPSSSKEQIALSVIHLDSAGESFSSKEQTATLMHIDTLKDEPISSRELARAQSSQIASTKDESSTPKRQEVVLVGNYSGRRSPNNVLSETSLRVEKAASASLSLEKNNTYNVSSNAPLKINSSTQSPSTSQPVSQMPVPASVAVKTEPPSLFLQALSKLDESSLTLPIVNRLGLQSSLHINSFNNTEAGDITPPDSLLSAPPTYSFVLRQMAVRRRPRYMGTFIPSPSFIQQTPPPTYTGAYDVYLEPAIPPPPPRVYSYGFSSMPIICPECGFAGMTVVTSHITICTHICAFVLCLFCCWVCAPLPYILRSCKDVYHYCRNCRNFLGMYSPTNPENVYPSP